MNLTQLFSSQVAARGKAPALIEIHRGVTRVISFAELDIAARRVTTLFQKSGLQPADGVLIFLPMSTNLYTALLAIMRCRLVAIFLDPSSGRKHIEGCCAIQRPRALLAGSKTQLLGMLSLALRRIPIKFSIGPTLPGISSFESAERLPPAEDIVPCASQTPALLTFTSGSTGRPKAALRTHGFLQAQYDVLKKSLVHVPGEVEITTLPIFGLANLASGMTTLIPDADLRLPGVVDCRPVLTQIEVHRPDRITASPAFLERLADFCVQNSKQLIHVKKIFTGGGPVFPGLLDKLHTVAPRAQIAAVYGSTEVEPIACVTYDEISADDQAAMMKGHGLLAGLPVPEIEVRIITNQWGRPIGPYSACEFADKCVPVRQTGEIVISGEHVLPSYLHSEGDDASKFRGDGGLWHRTGDAGWFDERGRLWLLGRCSARIEDACGEIYPFSVECVAHNQPGVRRAALVAHRGQRLLIVEATAEVDLHVLRARLGWARIDAVKLIRKLPVDKRHNSKIDYPALEELLG